MPCSSCVENCWNNAKSSQTWIFIFFHLVKNDVGIGCKQLVGHNSIFSAVLWQNPIKHTSNIHPNVFNSFYRTVTYLVTHRIIYKEILSMRWSPHFSAFVPTSQQKSPQTGTCHFTILPHPPKQVQKTQELCR